MKASGQLRKMKVEIGPPVAYTLNLGDDAVNMNDLIGSEIKLDFEHRITCIVCGRETKKAFGQGMCYPCFANAPENAECIIRPELCEAHLGKGRDPEWEKIHHATDHYVYLALSSSIKVGVTRGTQVPDRWIDQGATAAIKFALVPYRRLAGEIEVALKAHLTDRTDWRKMLKNEVNMELDLLGEKDKLGDELDPELAQYITDEDEVLDIEYPVDKYPLKVKSVGFDKLPTVEGKLTGIKGQYLLFSDDRVLNIRKHSGYHVTLEA